MWQIVPTETIPDQNPARTALHDAAVIGIIGGADGPTAIISGPFATQGKLRAACSSLRFDPVDRVEWRLVFREKRYQDKTFDIQV